MLQELLQLSKCLKSEAVKGGGGGGGGVHDLNLKKRYNKTQGCTVVHRR